jgi:isoleucyl-tRNA synthetase
VLVFTSEEVWGTRFPEGGSVHLLEWPELPTFELDKSLLVRNTELRDLRSKVTEAIEPYRRDKTIGSSLEAEVTMSDLETILRDLEPDRLAEVFISATVNLVPGHQGISVTKTSNLKCSRCWRHLPEVAGDGDLCARCADVVGQ